MTSIKGRSDEREGFLRRGDVGGGGSARGLRHFAIFRPTRFINARLWRGGRDEHQHASLRSLAPVRTEHRDSDQWRNRGTRGSTRHLRRGGAQNSTATKSV